jgi:hypothetical protein
VGLNPSHPVKGDQKGRYGFVIVQFLIADFAARKAGINKSSRFSTKTEQWHPSSAIRPARQCRDRSEHHS